PAEISGAYTSIGPSAPAVAVDSNGTAIIAFGADSSADRKIFVSEDPSGGPPASAIPLEPPAGTEGFRPEIATNGVGDAGIVFDVIDEGENDVYASRRTGPGIWTTPELLNDEEKPAVADTARAAMGPDGSLYAVWKDAGNKEVIFGSLDPSGSPDREMLITAAEAVEKPAIAADDEGRLLVAWITVSESGTKRTVSAKYREPEDEDFGQSKNVSLITKINRDHLFVAIDRDGRNIVTWSDLPSPMPYRTMASVRSPGSNFFSSEVPLSDPVEQTAPSGISSDADGHTLVALYMSSPLPSEARIVAFDAAAPALQDLSIPAAGVAGTPTPFSVSPLDAWSSTEPAEWQFGDGASADGDSTAHTYDAPGTYPVEVSVADEFGNLSQAAGTTAIEPAPVIPDERPGKRGKGKGRGADQGPAPRLGRLTLSRKRFRATPRRPSRTALASRRKRSRVGTRVGYRLSEPATVRFVVHRRLPGLRVRVRGRVRCVKPTRRLRRRSAKRCVRLRRRGAFRHAGKRGANRFFFSGWIGRKKLRPGRYRLRAVAIDRSGKRSAPRAVGFVISRR
ncbi:MAG TPA: PKD domain-containing protein, partial [Solirubrobacterales bacterium]